MLRPVIAALVAAVLSTQAFAGDGIALDPKTYMIGDHDAYEDDYSDEYERATDEQYKARHGDSVTDKRLVQKEWTWFEPIEDGDPMWSAPIYRENLNVFHHLNTCWPMECARTLKPWDFYFSMTAQTANEEFERGEGAGGAGSDSEEVSWDARANIGVIRLQVGMPIGLEVGLKYIFGEVTAPGHHANSVFWFENRGQIVRDNSRSGGSKAIELNVKWNLWHHDDQVSGFAFNIKGKYSLGGQRSLIDTTRPEGGANLIGSIKWGIATFHLNIGGIYTRSTGHLFYRIQEFPGDNNGDRPETRPFFTAGFAATFQIFDFLMAIAQVETHTNAWRRELEDTYHSKLITTGTVGMRARVGPLVVDGSVGFGFQHEAAKYNAGLTVGIKF